MHAVSEELADIMVPATLPLVSVVAFRTVIGREALRGLHMENEIARRQILSEQEVMRTRQLWMLIEIWDSGDIEAACRA